jgi:predicted metalloendopeptidase
MSDGYYKPSRNRKTRRQKKNPTKGLNCQIVTYPALTYSSEWIGQDFYTWVNKKWISDTTIPPFENDFGASEEIEQCIEDEIMTLMQDIFEKKKPTPEELALQNLHASFHGTSDLTFVKDILDRVNCVQSVRDVMKHMGLLCKYRIPGIFILDYVTTRQKRLELCLTPSIPGMAEKLYSSPEFLHKYKEYMHKIGRALDLDRFERIVPFEKKLVQRFDDDEEDKMTSTKGYGLARKFNLPWDAFFEAAGLPGWEKLQISYQYPKMIRGLRSLLNQVPLSLWKMYILKCYLWPLIKYMGKPFDEFQYEFIGRYLQGQKEKTPAKEVFLDFLYDTMPDTVSRLFWQRCGDQATVTGVEKIAKTIHAAAISRMRENTWLSLSSRVASIEKIKAITYKIGRPAVWEDEVAVELDPKDCVKNRFILGELSMATMIGRLGKRHTFWEEGVFRVNAYYYTTFNEIVFPYGILSSPFYKKDVNPSWNYGGIGATLGHELCHAFDDEGKEYDQYGMVRRWWTRKDIQRYNKRAELLEKIYSSVQVLGKHLDGENTLSENIADVSGLSICLEALRANLAERGITCHEDICKEYRIFFISYATSWRTLYRTKKLRSSLATDVHSPPYVRVNKVVSQMDEWYDAFDITPDSPLYTKPEDRIRFF